MIKKIIFIFLLFILNCYGINNSYLPTNTVIDFYVEYNRIWRINDSITIERFLEYYINNGYELVLLPHSREVVLWYLI